MDMTLIPVEQVSEGVRLHLTGRGCGGSRMHRKPNQSAARRLGRETLIRLHGAWRGAHPGPAGADRHHVQRRCPAPRMGLGHGRGPGVTYAPDADAALTQLIAEREVERDRQRARGRYAR